MECLESLRGPLARASQVLLRRSSRIGNFSPRPRGKEEIRRPGAQGAPPSFPPSILRPRPPGPAADHVKSVLSFLRSILLLIRSARGRNARRTPATTFLPSERATNSVRSESRKRRRKEEGKVKLAADNHLALARSLHMLKAATRKSAARV